MNKQLVKIGEWILLILTFLFPIISVATDRWTVISFPVNDQEIGAFESCFGSICRDTEDIRNIDSDAVKATQAFSVIGLLITIPLVILCVLCDLKSVMPSGASDLIGKLVTFRQSKYFMIACLVAAVSFLLAFFSWIAVDEDFNNADGGFSWAFMFLSAVFIGVLGFIPYVAPSEAKGSSAGSQSGQNSKEGANAPRQPANQQTVAVEESN